MTDQIYAQALALLGGSCDNEQALRASCEAAERELAGRLRKKLTPEGIRDVFSAAAAILALSLYTQLGDLSGTGADSVSSFRAGDVSVTKRGAGSVRSGANALRAQAEAMLMGCLEDRDFQFRGVRG